MILDLIRGSKFNWDSIHHWSFLVVCSSRMPNLSSRTGFSPTIHLFFLFFFFLHLYFFGLKIFVVMFFPYFQPYPLLFQTCLFLCSECRDQMNLTSCSDEMVVLFHTHTCLCVYDVTLIQFCCLMDIYRFLCECVTSTKFPPELSDMISFLPFFFQNIRNFFSVLYAHT